jgi:hypothetical protein
LSGPYRILLTGIIQNAWTKFRNEFPTPKLGKMFSKLLISCLTDEATLGGDGISDLHSQHQQAEDN